MGPSKRAVACALVVAMGSPRVALAGDAGTSPSSGNSRKASEAPAENARGVAVVARAGAENAGWALAKEVYARATLRPAGLDEARARVLVGDPAPGDAPQAVKDLVDERASVHGDDGASRALLRSIASQLGVRALLVVEPALVGGSPGLGTGTGASTGVVARVFLTDSGTFDAARYEPDASPPELIADAGAPAALGASSDGGNPVPSSPPTSPSPFHWSGAVASLDRAYGGAAETELRAPSLATSALPPVAVAAKTTESRPFYTSPWFWGAVGAAAFGGAAVYFATRDNSAGTIHLELQVPK